jgi:hypothetical protein
MYFVQLRIAVFSNRQIVDKHNNTMLSERPRQKEGGKYRQQGWRHMREQSTTKKRGRRAEKENYSTRSNFYWHNSAFGCLFFGAIQQPSQPQSVRGKLLRGLLGYGRHMVELRYRDIYDDAYGKKVDDRAHHEQEILERVNFVSTNSYATPHCSLTVVLMDPRIAHAGHGQPVWFALESVALHTDSATCFLIQTSSCRALNEDYVRQHIYHHALPHFRRVMEQQRTRITFLRYSAYNMDSCDDFNPNAVFSTSTTGRMNLLKLTVTSFLWCKRMLSLSSIESRSI